MQFETKMNCLDFEIAARPNMVK